MNNKECSRVHTVLAGSEPGGLNKQHYPTLGHQKTPGAAPLREYWPRNELPERGGEKEGVVPLTPLKFKVLCPGEKSLFCLQPTRERVVSPTLVESWLQVSSTPFIFQTPGLQLPCFRKTELPILSIWDT